MPTTLLLLRILHLALGTFWVGTVVFFALFLEPTVRAVGPDAGKVMIGLAARRFSTFILMSGVVTILTGFWLFMINASGPEWMHTRAATAYSTGAVAALIAIIIGGAFIRPAVAKLTAPGGMQSPEAPALRERLKVAGRVVASLLTITVITMAVARYL